MASSLDFMLQNWGQRDMRPDTDGHRTMEAACAAAESALRKWLRPLRWPVKARH
jgi:hypothetical protein